MEKDNQSLVSVVIPTFNRADTIISCLDSVLNQTYENIEVIIVDDCSTDNTREVLKSISDSRVTCYFLPENHRACYARNYGAERAKGEFIAFQDSDDLWHKDKIEKQVRFINETNSDFVFCGMNRYNSDKTESFYFPQEKLSENTNYYIQELMTNVISTQTILMRSKCFESVRFDVDFRKYQDWDFAIRAAKAFKISYLPEPLVDSFIQENSISLLVNHYDALCNIYKKYEKEIVDHPDINALHLARMGDCFRKSDPKKAKRYYKESLHNAVRFKVIIKYCFSSIGIKRF